MENSIIITYYSYEGRVIVMTIKVVLNTYQDEMFVHGGKAKAISKIIKEIKKQEEAKNKYEKRLELTSTIERRN